MGEKFKGFKSLKGLRGNRNHHSFLHILSHFFLRYKHIQHRKTLKNPFVSSVSLDVQINLEQVLVCLHVKGTRLAIDINRTGSHKQVITTLYGDNLGSHLDIGLFHISFC